MPNFCYVSCAASKNGTISCMPNIICVFMHSIHFVVVHFQQIHPPSCPPLPHCISQLQALFPAPNDQSAYSWTVCELDLCNAHAGLLMFVFDCYTSDFTHVAIHVHHTSRLNQARALITIITEIRSANLVPFSSLGACQTPHVTTHCRQVHVLRVILRLHRLPSPPHRLRTRWLPHIRQARTSTMHYKPHLDPRFASPSKQAS